MWEWVAEDLPEPDDSQHATRQDNELSKVVSEWHTCENREGCMELLPVSLATVKTEFYLQ